MRRLVRSPYPLLLRPATRQDFPLPFDLRRHARPLALAAPSKASATLAAQHARAAGIVAMSRGCYPNSRLAR